MHTIRNEVDGWRRFVGLGLYTRHVSGSRERFGVFTAAGGMRSFIMWLRRLVRGAATVSCTLQWEMSGGSRRARRATGGGCGWGGACRVTYNKYKYDTPTMWRGPALEPLCDRCLAAWGTSWIVLHYSAKKKVDVIKIFGYWRGFEVWWCYLFGIVVNLSEA